MHQRVKLFLKLVQETKLDAFQSSGAMRSFSPPLAQETGGGPGEEGKPHPAAAADLETNTRRKLQFCILNTGRREAARRENFTVCSYFALLQVGVELFALQELLHLGLDQHAAHVDDLFHRQGQALHRVAELLLNTAAAEVSLPLLLR